METVLFLKHRVHGVLSGGNKSARGQRNEPFKLWRIKSAYDFFLSYLVLAAVNWASPIPLANAAPSTRILLTPITSSTDLQTAVSAWCTDPVAAPSTYGDISDWDISTVTSSEDLFNAYCSSTSTFNQPFFGSMGSF